MRKFLFICALLCMGIYDVNAQDKDIVLEKQADSIRLLKKNQKMEKTILYVWFKHLKQNGQK